VIPFQTNSYDCGVFVCLYAAFIDVQKQFTFLQIDIDDILMWIVHAMDEDGKQQKRDPRCERCEPVSLTATVKGLPPQGVDTLFHQLDPPKIMNLSPQGNTSRLKRKWEYSDSETLIPPTTKRDDSNSCKRECDAANHPIGGDTDNKTSVLETIDIDAGSRSCDTHQNIGMSSGDARDSDGARHSDIMIQDYRLLEYSHLVTDIQQSQRPPDTPVGETSERQKMCEFATDATGDAALVYCRGASALVHIHTSAEAGGNEGKARSLA
jgi:hypothetical protein